MSDASSIPTVMDIANDLAQRITTDAIRDAGEYLDVICEARCADPLDRPAEKIPDYVAFARACHQAADALRKCGEIERADMYFALAQDMLTGAIEAMEALHAIHTRADMVATGKATH